MTDLQTALSIIGVIIVVLIYIFSNRARGPRRPINKDAPRLDELDNDDELSGDKFTDEPDDTADDDMPAWDPPSYANPDSHANHIHSNNINHNNESVHEKYVAEKHTSENYGSEKNIPDQVSVSSPASNIHSEDSKDENSHVENLHDENSSMKNLPSENFTAQPSTTLSNSPTEFIPPKIDGFERLSQIDYWVRITGERDVGRETVLAIYHDGVRNIGKTHSIHGMQLPEKTWRDVESASEGARFADLILTIQLADQVGPISESEMTEFSNLVTKLSEGTAREFLFMTTIDNAFLQADALNRFIRHFDSVFAINIWPKNSDAFQGAAIDRCALQVGLERDGECYYSRFKPVGKNKVKLYSIANMSESGQFDFDNMHTFSTRGLVLFTKPAANRSPGAVFAEMVDSAKAVAARISGVVTDPNHAELSQHDVEKTRRAIEQTAESMNNAGIAAGSDEATRLF